MKVIANIAVLVVIALAAYSLSVAMEAPGKRLYPKILALHTDPAARPKENGQLPYLYVSWFYQNSREGGEDYALYNNGRAIMRRITQSGIQGGSGPIQNQLELQGLKHISSLPPGLSDPDALPPARLLIVSLHQATWWKTYYYDRRNLPAQVQPIAQLAQASSLNTPI